MADLPPPDECANCGARIPRGAKACPECGADERTGWRESSIYDGLELPDTAFESESESEGDRKRGTRRHAHVNGIRWYWWLVAILVIAALLGVWVW